MRLPSVKTLRVVFGDNAKQARHILEMSRAELSAHPVGAARVAECYNPPKTYDVRLTVLASLDPGLFEWESFITDANEPVCYVNAGDTYTPTVIYFRGRYQVACWSDIAEKHGAI